jgi:phytoene desaturase
MSSQTSPNSTKAENSNQENLPKKLVVKINQKRKGKKVVVIGAGFSGLSSACYLAKAGFEVLVVEKNPELGGRARVWEAETEKGKFVFDMGPSWYWMPDIFEDFFGDFGKKVDDLYDLKKLDKQYRMFVGENVRENLEGGRVCENLGNGQGETLEDDEKSGENGYQNFLDLPSEYEEIKVLFEKLEAGSGAKLDEFAKHGDYTYHKAVNEYMQKPSLSVLEFAGVDFISGILRAGILDSYGDFVKKSFQNKFIRQMLEFPVLFLGATPAKTPKIYTLMAWTCLKQGTFYPSGGMGKLVDALTGLAKSLGVKFLTNTEIIKIESEK